MLNLNLLDPFTLIASGTMTIDLLQVGKVDYKTTFFIKESHSRLNMIPKDKINLEFRSSLMVMDEALLVLLMLRIENNPNFTYQIWLNYHHSEEVKKCFQYLATQEQIRILFIDENNQLINIIGVSNNLRIGFMDYLQRLKKRIPWNKADFEYAKAKILQRYPDPLSLWHGIKYEKTRCNR
jgi:hypothetical protein